MTNRVSSIISDQTLSRIIQIESAGRPTAKAPTSSATGLGQFLNATWLGTVQKHRPDWLQDRTRSQVLDMRLDPAASIEMLARFTEDNARALGGGYTDGDIYLAHFSGVGVARELLRAPASDPASQHFSPAAIAANRSILQGKTVGQVRAWASRKMAAAGRTNWIARYWTDAAPPARLLPDDPPADATGVKVEEAEPAIAGLASDPAVGALTAAPAAGLADVDIEVVQRRLTAMNYTPGGIDGGTGGVNMTKGAIAEFKSARNLPGEPVIDDALKAALARAEADGHKRPIAAARAQATEAAVAQNAPEVVPVKQSRIAALWAGVSAAALAAVNFISDRFQETLTWLMQAKSYLNAIPGWMWLLGIVAGLFYFYFKSKKGVEGINDAVRTGKRT